MRNILLLGAGSSTMNGRGNVPLGVDDADEDSPPGYMTAAGTRALCLHVQSDKCYYCKVSFVSYNLLLVVF